MLEHYTEAFVFDNKINKELDAVITLYTRDFGKVIARAKSARKITSKLNSHLQPLNFANVRLIEKNALSAGKQRFQVVDALTIENNSRWEKNPGNLAKFLNIAQFINEMTFELHQDLRLWQAIKKIFSADLVELEDRIIYLGLLKILGFDSEYASCVVCDNPQTDYFSKSEHIFLCIKCACPAKRDSLAAAGKITQNQLLFIGNAGR